MMTTRRRKYCAVLGVLFSVVILCVSTVTAFATGFAGSLSHSYTPPLYMDFRYRVYESQSAIGDIYSSIVYSDIINCPVGDSSYTSYDGNGVDDPAVHMDGSIEESNTSVLFNHSQSLVVGSFSWTQNLRLASQDSQYDDFGSDGFDYSQRFEYYNFIDGLEGVVDLAEVNFHCGNYYVYGSNVDGNTLSDGTPLNVRLAIPRDAYDEIRLTVSYSTQGDTEMQFFSLDNHSILYDDEYVYFNVSGSMLNIPSTEIAYIHQATLTLSDSSGDFNYPSYSRSLDDFFFDCEFYVDIQGTVLTRDNRNIDVKTHTVEYEFANYTEWLGNAIGGFMSTEIFGGITFGGILAMILGFFGVVWFLKLFAGG